MAHPPRQLTMVRDAIEVVMRRLSSIAPSPEVEELRTTAEEYMRQTDSWRVSPPPNGEHDDFMKRVLKLHMALAKMERGTSRT
jgi:hypothetical protein